MTVSSSLPVIFLFGPTASGKTELAHYLYEHLPLQLISVDSAAVYRDMDIGTAKPTPKEQAITPYELIDICDPIETYSAGQFRVDALARIAAAHAQNRIPLFVGGTMMYFRALEHGWADLPGADEVVRAEISNKAAQSSWAALHAELEAIDPEAHARIHPNDTQRIQRALEVHALTGRPISDWQADSQSELPYRLIKIAIQHPNKTDLHARIERRFDRLMDAGFIEEVMALHQRGDLHVDLPSIRSVGYRQVWAYLDGEYDLETARERAVIATRQLAKHQMTWLRADSEITWISGSSETEHWQALQAIRAQLNA